MSEYITFSWKGVPIRNIRFWAKERGEKMVSYRAHRKRPNFLGAAMVTEEYFGEMPELFFNNLRMDNGWIYSRKEA